MLQISALSAIVCEVLCCLWISREYHAWITYSSGIKGLPRPYTIQKIRVIMAESRLLLSKLSYVANKRAFRDFVWSLYRLWISRDNHAWITYSSGIKGFPWPCTIPRIRAIMAESRLLLSKLSCVVNKRAFRDFLWSFMPPLNFQRKQYVYHPFQWYKRIQLAMHYPKNQSYHGWKPSAAVKVVLCCK